MKRIYFLMLLSGLYACTKKDAESPNFEVTWAKTSYAVNEPILFKFTGSADIISFYSGQPGKEYEFRDRYRVDGIPQMKFTSYRQFGPQNNTLNLLASMNFNGVFNPENIALATWTDITSRATLSTGADNTASGIVDLSDFMKPDSVVYIAFRYIAKADPAISQPTWTIKNIFIDNKIADGSLVAVANSANITWGAVNVANPARTWSFSATQIQMTGGPANTEDNEDWIITKPLSLDRVQRSLSVNVRTSPAATETSYLFAGYTAPGTYKATFEVTNANKWNIKRNVKEIVITVQ
jgi:uncharacterized protein DUF5017